MNLWPRPIQQPHPPVWVPGLGSLETWAWCLDHDYNYSYLSFSGYKRAQKMIDALQLQRPFVLGESMGGWIAAEMAALRPDKIGRLALAAPVGLWRDDAPVADMCGMMGHEMVPYLFHDTTCPAAQAMLGLSQLVSDKDDRSAEQVEMLIAMARGARTAAKFLFPIPENGLERRLWRIQAPTMIVWGSHDRFVQPSYADLFAAQIRDAEVVTIKNAGHLIGLEQPAAFAEAILRWPKRD